MRPTPRTADLAALLPRVDAVLEALAVGPWVNDARHEGPLGTLDPERLQVLADALEEAGYEEGLVAHLRSPGPHVRGCYVLDALTGRG